MGVRVISAVMTGSSADRKNGSTVSFGSSVSFGSPVSGMVCVGGNIIFSKFKGYASSFYFEIYIDGAKACKTRVINDQNSISHELEAYIDSNGYVDSDLLLMESGDIEVIVRDPGNSSNVCNFREGCKITINANYAEESSGGGEGGGEGTDEEVVTSPTWVSVSAAKTQDDTITLTWGGATAIGSNKILGYEVYADDDMSGEGDWTGWFRVSPEGVVVQSPYEVPTPEPGAWRQYLVRTVSTNYASSNGATSGVVYRLPSITRCKEPKTVTVERTITSAATNRLSWSGAEPGENNAIAGYFILYQDSVDNKNWGLTWFNVKSVGTETSTEVPMPEENVYRKFKVYTLGAAGSNYRSSGSTDSNVTFRGHADLDGFTDSPLVAGETHVKALHMQELQDRANTLREFNGLQKYNFTQIVSGETGLKDWTAHVNEIRAAIDEIDTNHAAWIAFSVNCPRADVIEQMRTVILAM